VAIRPETLAHFHVYRERLNGYLHLSLLWDGVRKGDWVPENDLVHGPSDFAETLRTVTFGWLASFVDKRNDSLNAFELWRELFPEHHAEIDRVERSFEPLRGPLKAFRDKVSAHADRDPTQQDKARKQLRDQRLPAAHQQFLDLALLLLREEQNVPELKALQGKTA
jgi:ferric-dicitrate binding protein FerR (iron transport regulator)